MILIKRIVCIGVSPPQKHYPLFLASLPPPLVKFANFRKFYKLFFVRFYFVFLSKNCTPPPPEKSYPLFPSNPPITPPPPPPQKRGSAHYETL